MHQGDSDVSSAMLSVTLIVNSTFHTSVCYQIPSWPVHDKVYSNNDLPQWQQGAALHPQTRV